MEDEEYSTPKPRTPIDKPLDRDTLRAEALRANLMRRKAQARGRGESNEVSPAKSPGDA